MKSLYPIGLFVLGVLVVGCYSLQPIPSSGPAPDVGSRVALDVNDRGRVALGGSMGPEIAQIEGRLLGVTDQEYVIAVEVVRLVRGGEQIWSGEETRISREYVGLAYEREFSAGRSATMGAVAIGGIVAFVVTRTLLGGGSGEPGEKPDTGVSTVRIPRR